MHNLHKDSPFFLKKEKLWKIKKFEANLHDKKEYVVHTGNLKQALNHGLVLKKLHKVIKFNQKAWLKSYTDINTKLRKNAKMISKKFFLS